MIEVKVTKNTIPAGLLKAAKEVKENLATALETVMELKRTEVVRRTPADTGTLRSTVRLNGPTITTKAVSCSVVAGGARAPYAIVQHEDLTYRHTVGQAKYIESVFFESRATITKEIMDRMKF
jgi:hypothetical protein